MLTCACSQRWRWPVKSPGNGNNRYDGLASVRPARVDAASTQTQLFDWWPLNCTYTDLIDRDERCDRVRNEMCRPEALNCRNATVALTRTPS